MVARLTLDLCCSMVVIGAIYARRHASREFVFTYYLFNLITCVLCLLLRRVPTELGFALALFGVFGILRYRTEQIRIRELTYLFIVIGIGLLNGVADSNVSLAELLLVNGVIIAMTAWQEVRPAHDRQKATSILYDQLPLLLPTNRSALLTDINAKTGFRVLRVEVVRIDLLRDCAEITVFHHDDS